jgi:hypothetical protein
MIVLKELQFPASRVAQALEALVFVAGIVVIAWGALVVCVPAARDLL